MAITPAITPKINVYVGTAMTLNRVTPDCITVPLSPKIVRELLTTREGTWEEIRRVSDSNVKSLVTEPL